MHGEFDLTEPAGYWSDARLAGFRSAGIRIEGGGAGGDDGPPAGAIRLKIPLTVGVRQPRPRRERWAPARLSRALAAERQYRNDEQIDNALRSVLFQVADAGYDRSRRPASLPVVSAACFTGVVDLGAIDIERERRPRHAHL